MRPAAFLQNASGKQHVENRSIYRSTRVINYKSLTPLTHCSRMIRFGKMKLYYYTGSMYSKYRGTLYSIPL